MSDTTTIQFTPADRENFLARCLEVREVVATYKNPLVVGHYDADGLSSTALAMLAIREMKGSVPESLTLRKLDDEAIQKIKNRECVFVDFGSGFAGTDEVKDAVVIDHHQPQKLSTLQANPLLFNIDGGFELSAAGTAYCVFRTAVDLAIVGAVGDMQYPLIGMNRWVLEQGTGEGRLSHGIDIRLFGRVSRPLLQMLLFADDPYLPGLTGNENAALQFLESLNIPAKSGDRWLTYSELNNDDRKRFVSGLIEYLSEKGMTIAAKELIGEVYLLLERPKNTELSDASEFSTLLNACGRNRRPEVGLNTCLGELGAFAEAKNLLAVHRKNLRNGIEYANRSVEDFGKFLFIDGRNIIDDGIIGVVAGMLYAGGRKKPILAVSYDETGNIKISGRGTKKLVAEGLNLGKMLSESAAAVGGAGGGHRIAAGATISRGKLTDFLKEASSRI